MDDKVLGRSEAALVADMLKKKGKSLPNGFNAVWRLKPSQVAERYGVKIKDVVEAARRQDDETQPVS